MRDTASERGESVSLMTKAGRALGAVASLALLVGLIAWGWRTGTQDVSELPVIVAQAGPARVAPEDPGGTIMPHQGRSVNTVVEGVRPEAPDEVTLAPAPMAPGAQDSIAEAPDTQDEIADLLAGVLAETETTAGTAPAPVEIAGDPGAPVISPAPRARPSGLSTRASAAPAPQRPVAVDASAIPDGAHMVQLGAFLSEEIALEQWEGLTARQPSLMAGKQRYIETTVSGGVTRYRLRAVGYASGTETRAACAAFVARGHDCIPVTK